MKSSWGNVLNGILIFQETPRYIWFIKLKSKMSTCKTVSPGHKTFSQNPYSQSQPRWQLISRNNEAGGKREIKTFIIKNNILLLTYLLSIFFSFLWAAYKFLKAALESGLLTSWSDYPCQFFFVLPVLLHVLSFTLTSIPNSDRCYRIIC